MFFVDEDILAPKDLVSNHVRAHKLKPNSVICGRCILVKPAPIPPPFDFLNSLDALNHPKAYFRIAVAA